MRAIAKSLRNRLRNDDGQALVELAFVLPLLLLFLFGIIDFGLALNTANTDTNVANIAVREASVVGTTTSVPCVQGTTTTNETNLQAWAQCEMVSSGSGTPSVCVYDVNDGLGTSSTQQQTYTVGDTIKVEASSVFNWSQILTGKDNYIGKVVSPTTTIVSSAQMRLEVSLGTSTTGTNAFLAPTCTS